MSSAYVKRSSQSPSDFYAVEAAGLRWLAEAGPGSAAVVGVREVDEHQIVLDRLEPVRPTPEAAADFGRALARTHAAGAAAFGQPPAGWSGDGYIGQQRLSLQPEPTWGAFYARQRVWPYAQRAHQVGNLSDQSLQTVELVCRRLAAGKFDDGRPPARIHGDLWAGNVIFTSAGVVLIDPAAHGGHGLTDLAMVHLFGAPQLRAITAAYANAAGLPEGWESMLGLHQLHPLLVHAVSHGASYGVEAGRVAQLYA